MPDGQLLSPRAGHAPGGPVAADASDQWRLYAEAYNRRHGKVGHLFQGHFKAILVDRDAYLLEVCRYVDLNPVRAALVADPADWPWSSCRAHAGLGTPPEWLDTAALQGYLLGHDPADSREHKRAARRYATLVAQGKDVKLWDKGLRQQVFLGDTAFVERMQALLTPEPSRAADVPRIQRRPPLLPWDDGLPPLPCPNAAGDGLDDYRQAPPFEPAVAAFALGLAG